MRYVRARCPAGPAACTASTPELKAMPPTRRARLRWTHAYVLIACPRIPCTRGPVLPEHVTGRQAAQRSRCFRRRRVQGKIVHGKTLLHTKLNPSRPVSDDGPETGTRFSPKAGIGARARTDDADRSRRLRFAATRTELEPKYHCSSCQPQTYLRVPAAGPSWPHVAFLKQKKRQSNQVTTCRRKHAYNGSQLPRLPLPVI
jgi:hypothetical protein